jgi:hypothetical protein
MYIQENIKQENINQENINQENINQNILNNDVKIMLSEYTKFNNEMININNNLKTEYFSKIEPMDKYVIMLWLIIIIIIIFVLIIYINK